MKLYADNRSIINISILIQLYSRTIIYEGASSTIQKSIIIMQRQFVGLAIDKNKYNEPH